MSPPVGGAHYEEQSLSPAMLAPGRCSGQRWGGKVAVVEEDEGLPEASLVSSPCSGLDDGRDP